MSTAPRARWTGAFVMIGIAAVATVALSGCGPAAAPTSGGAGSVVAPAATEGLVSAVAPSGDGLEAGSGGWGGSAAAGSGSAGSGSAGSGSAGSGSAGSGSGGSGSGGGGSPGTGSAGTGSGGGGSGAGAGPGGGGPAAPPAARIASFRVVTQPSCPVVGTGGRVGSDAPFSAPGNGVTISWSVTGADGAAIAVDDPGTYGAYGSSYPSTGRLDLSFPCGTAGTTSHTYTVWPAGAKGVSKTLTVSARANG